MSRYDEQSGLRREAIADCAGLGPIGYQPRAVTQYGVEVINGWSTKVYGLREPQPALITAAKEIAREVLPPGEGAAFVIAHRARPACFVLVYWWATEVDLSLRYFRSPLERPAELESLPANAVGCVWELALVGHERDAWVRHMLGDGDLAAYLQAGAPPSV
jgi:hypothetical protein